MPYFFFPSINDSVSTIPSQIVDDHLPVNFRSSICGFSKGGSWQLFSIEIILVENLIRREKGEGL